MLKYIVINSIRSYPQQFGLANLFDLVYNMVRHDEDIVFA